MVIAILLFVTIYHTYSKQQKTVTDTRYPSLEIKDTNLGAELLNPSNIILVKLP